MALSSERIAPSTRSLVGNHGTYVNGKWISTGGDTIAITDPATGQIVGSVEGSTVAAVESAVGAARAAFDSGTWSRMSARDRSTLIRRLAEIVDARFQEFTELGVLDVGTPVELSRLTHASAPAKFFHWYADVALQGPLGGYEQGLGISWSPVPAASSVHREPRGVVAAIAAYNFPMLISTFKTGAALASGCTVVLMPSPHTVTSAMALMSCIEEAGFPPGVVNLVMGGPDVGVALTESPGVDMVSFTGSVAVGRMVLGQATKSLKKVVLELGGKSPNILLPSADPAVAVGPSILRFTRNAGQACGATTRTLVPRDRYDEYSELADNYMKSMVIGDPWNEETSLGPLISDSQRNSVTAAVQRALQSGGQLVAGSDAAIASEGFFMPPSLVGRIGPDSEIAQEELFGPVGALLPYDTVDHAIEIANGTRYGLNANVWGDTAEALKVARRLKAGTVTINGGGEDRPDAPWPGAGDSAYGVDRGMDGFQEFFKVRHVQFTV